MPIAKHSVIIDTNLWISFLLTNNFAKIDRLVKDNKLTLLFSQELLDEFVEVAQRPKFKKYFSTNDLQDLLSQIRIKAKFIAVTTFIDICRYKKDNFLLALAIDGKATHLITGDKDLLVLKKIDKTEIITMSNYLTKD